MRATITITGIVQGVGFRPFVYRIATKNGLVGFVRNRGDAGVQIVVQGLESDVKKFLRDLEEKKPPLARYDSVTLKYVEDGDELQAFSIAESSEERELSGSIIPPDVAICDECTRELQDPSNRRHEYFFITCTDCGPRFTTIEKLPYDRPNTTMKDFPLCPECIREYKDPTDRRFHAQTIACLVCGPRVFLTDNKGDIIKCEDPIRYAGKLLEEGYIVSIKGNGGFHVATSTLRQEAIARLRMVKHRSHKPFAIMARDLEAVRSFAKVSEEEKKLLLSYMRPIVLLKKREDFYLSELISPGLHNIGVMLPYTALHLMLFDEVHEPALVMTSANPPAEPIIKDNGEALKKLGSMVDYFLLHDREIAHRTDDSVVRVNNGAPLIIRRSRGYAPAPIHLKRKFGRCVVGLGAELFVTSCAIVGEKAFISQHIGDVENIETYQFFKDATFHLLRLVNARPKLVVCDLHPTMNTTRLAHEMGNELNVEVLQIQHHHAHVASLMAEYGLEEIIGIACDGVGYGADGKVWGGELILCDSSHYRRLGHLMEQPMVGGDLATYHPLRMVAGILRDIADVEEYLDSHRNHFPAGREEVEVILKQLQSGQFPKTTSTGRILDAVSALLGICYERTYEGEPAMMLEAVASEGKDVLNLEPRIDGNILDTTYLLKEIFERRRAHKTSDLAYSAQMYLAKGLATMAVDEAQRTGIRAVGLSGGVAYNEHIGTVIRRIVEENGLKFVAPKDIPPGDGGISLGQAYAASLFYAQQH